MELLSYIAFFVFGYWVASQVFALHLKYTIKKIAKENGIDLEEEQKPVVNKIPVLITEQVDNGILLYDNKNNFMCQGKSLEEVADNLIKYKNIKLAIVVHDNDKVWFIEGKIKKA